MTDPIRAALERLIARIKETHNPDDPVPGWFDSYFAARAALAEPLPPKVGHIQRLADIIEECQPKTPYAIAATALAQAILSHPDIGLVLGNSDGPAVLEGREPAFVAGEPSDEEFRQLYCDIFDLRCDPASLGPVPVKFARAVIALWGCQPPAEPTPPAVTISALLHPAYEPGDGSADCAQMVNGQWWHPCFGCDSLEIVLDNLLAVPPRPVPVSERLPEPNTKVLAHYFNDLGNGRTICAIWVPAKSWSDDIDDNYNNSDHLEYDETDDCYYWPEGWYETIENWDELGYVKVNEGDVIYWQPLPTWPANPTTTGNK